MKYSIDYQVMHVGKIRPSDDGVVVGIQANDEGGLVILPNVGDYVSVQNSGARDGRVSAQGRVRTRLFSYIAVTGGDTYCHVNIVLDEIEDDAVWASLIKE